tara:strand:+ start:86 stop:1141 length:1056 start_codon:yes stop_codon:yes gene_type:complete
MGLLDVLGSIGGGITAFDAAREPGRVSQRNRATAEAKAEEDERKRRREEFKLRKSLLSPDDIDGLKRITEEYKDVVGGETIIDILGTNAESQSNLGNIDAQISSESDVEKKLDVLEKAQRDGTITPREFATRRDELQAQSITEGKSRLATGEKALNEGLKLDPLLKQPQLTAQQRILSTQPETVNFESVNKNAKTLLKSDDATQEELVDARAKLVKYAAGNTEHSTIKSLDAEIALRLQEKEDEIVDRDAQLRRGELQEQSLILGNEKKQRDLDRNDFGAAPAESTAIDPEITRIAEKIRTAANTPQDMLDSVATVTVPSKQKLLIEELYELGAITREDADQFLDDRNLLF